MAQPKIVAVYGSPRRKGNTATLLKKAVSGAHDAGAVVEEIVLRDLKMSPCLEIYGCHKAGECMLKDDFQKARDLILDSQGLIPVGQKILDRTESPGPADIQPQGVVYFRGCDERQKAV